MKISFAKADAGGELEIWDMYGRIVCKQMINKNICSLKTEIPTGIYLCRVIFHQQASGFRKIIIQ